MLLHRARVREVGDSVSGVRLPSPDSENCAELYHEASKLSPTTVPQLSTRMQAFSRDPLMQTVSASPYKVYPGYPTVSLPRPAPITAGLTDTLTQRRTEHTYAQDCVIRSKTIGQWLGWGCGRGGFLPPCPDNLRTYPSAGALYPLEIYLSVRKVDELSPGLYHYSVFSHSLELLAGSEVVERSFDYFLQRDAASAAHIAVLITAVFARSLHKYGVRSYRFTLLEAGHLMQNLCLLAVPLRLAVTPIGGYYDDLLHDLLGVDGVDEALVYAAVASPRDP